MGLGAHPSPVREVEASHVYGSVRDDLGNRRSDVAEACANAEEKLNSNVHASPYRGRH